MNTNKNLLKHVAVGLLILFVFIIAVLSCGCTEKGKLGLNETWNLTSNVTGTEEIEVKCGIVNALCCENNTCNSNLSCIENKCMSFKIANISTEKPKYTANEEIKISLNINSTSDVNNVLLHVYGITSRQGRHLIDKTVNLNLTEKVNIQNFTVKAPTCTHGCGARYYPGNYPLHAEISYTDENNNVSFLDKKQVAVKLY